MNNRGRAALQVPRSFLAGKDVCFSEPSVVRSPSRSELPKEPKNTTELPSQMSEDKGAPYGKSGPRGFQPFPVVWFWVVPGTAPPSSAES